MVASTPASRKQKGRKFQQDIRDDIIALFEGKLTEDDVRSTSMGAAGTDILLSTRAKELFPFAPECKRVEALNVPNAYLQAKANAQKEKLLPILIHKRNREEALVTIEWKTFQKMIECLYSLRSEFDGLHGNIYPTLSDLLL